MSSNTDYENEPPANNSPIDLNTDRKTLLTQEFNTIPPVISDSLASGVTTTTMTLSNNNFSLYTAPFLMSPDDAITNPHTINHVPIPISAANAHIPAPAYFYHPFPFNLQPPPPQMISPEQYYIMMRSTSNLPSSSSFPQGVQSSVHNVQSAQNTLSLNRTTPKRIKLDETTSSLADQLNGFKDSLKTSFDRNLQKLEVLDRLVQTVQLRGSFNHDALRGSLELLKVSRTLLKELTSEQVDMTAALTSEIRNCLLPDILKLVKSCSFVRADCSKVELVDKLRKEEDSHLADLTILSARNKELQKDQRSLKDQLERLQLEYSDSLKLTVRSKEDHDQFLQRIRSVLGIEGRDQSQLSQVCLIEGVESVLIEKENLIERENIMKNELKIVFTELRDIKNDLMSLDGDGSIDYVSIIEDCLQGTLNLLFDKFEEISQSRERFFNDSLNSFNRKIDELLKIQRELTHKSLSLRVNLQGQISDAHENVFRLRRKCQELTSELNLSLDEIESKRLALQVKESESNEYKRRYENNQERLKILEQELSIKNQENRTFAIRIQGLEAEVEETRNQNRHDISALERKISILESKGSSSKLKIDDKKMDEEFVDMDPFSSVPKRDDQGGCVIDQSNQAYCVPNDQADVSVIPPTILPKTGKKYTVTFTGIRDSQKQKELTGWLHELGGVVHVGADFNDDITHILAPRGYRSIRVLAASLTGKWIVPIEWVESSHRAGHFVPESSCNGFNNASIRPFRFRTLWMSASFSATHKSHPVYPVTALRTLLEKLGKARWTETQGLADLLLVTEEEKDSKLITSGRGALITLNNLINMIPIEK